MLTVTDCEPEGFGAGEMVSWEDEEVSYSLDGAYELMGEIELDEEGWILPEGFNGTFEGKGPDSDSPLYDSETDTIIIYNNYQLMLMALEDAGEQPVMSMDMRPEAIGMGQPVYPDEEEGEEQEYLTYGKDHRYVISMDFTEEMPEWEAEEIADGVIWLDGEDAGGRERPGQLTAEIDGETYILIGNESQLRAIGSDKRVTPRLYLYTPGGLLFSNPKYTPYYPGDADLGLESVAPNGSTMHGTLNKDYDEVDQTSGYTYYGEGQKKMYELADLDLGSKSLLDGILSGLGGLVGTILGSNAILCGVDENGYPNKDNASLSELKATYGNLKYSRSANYIIFRDIDLKKGSNSDQKDTYWEPIHFSGKMEGRLKLQEEISPTISNITVEQTGRLDLEKDSGIGFFGTISSGTDSTSLKSAGTVTVKNLILDQVTVKNYSKEIDKAPDSLVDGITGLLGGLLGGILGSITSSLPILENLKLGDVIEDLLTLKRDSPDLFATGSFAGRITGNVSIENCKVLNASVSSVKGIQGGFAGYIEGEAEYDLLSQITGNTVSLLASLLNLVPGVGLGDLITILLENDIPVGNLIPIGYYNPILTECHVTLASGESEGEGTIGSLDIDYNGGFVGIQTGAITESCSVKELTQVEANHGAGGFAGLARDAVLKGALQDLGVQIGTFDVSSTQTDCVVSGDGIVIQAKSQYAGGFNGLMSNSQSQSCSVTDLQKVASGSYAGGFAGRATIGYGLAAGGSDEKKNTLLQAVSGLLKDVLASGDQEQLNQLLSLSGAEPSRITDCSVSGSSLVIQAQDSYAGGLVGQGDGPQLEQVSVNGLSLAEAESYAGGIAGSLSSADAIGVINNAVGVGQYLPFSLSEAVVQSDGLTIHAEKAYGAGGAGLLLGGSVKDTEIRGLSSVTAGNYAAGFMGRAGASSLAAAKGLNILGLVEVNNLLSLADGIRVTVENTHVSGGDTGFTVQADGSGDTGDTSSVLAGGFGAEATGVLVTDSTVTDIKGVAADGGALRESYAGGFVGRSHTGGLAGLAQETEDGKTVLPGIVTASSLLSLVPYLTPEYKNVSVHFVPGQTEPQVKGGLVGGFAGSIQSSLIDNQQSTEPFAVYGLEEVVGQSHAGGFAGKADAGATASSDGLNLLDGILNLNISDLVNVLNLYIPRIHSAGVSSGEKGFTVEATDQDSYAGGFIGHGSGVEIRSSDVTALKHTAVTPPGAGLEAADEGSYFTEQSEYAVKGGLYAGGYIGCVDIDSAAAVGGGLNLLDAVSLDGILTALDTVASTIEDSDVEGRPGGFSVLADGTDRTGSQMGKAGGFAGAMSGTWIKRSDVRNFSYIIGREMAGGYAGLMEPGKTASVLDDADILKGVADATGGLVSLVESFIPVIEDSRTSSVPCGGAVRADSLTDSKRPAGMAGGYVGYNQGGRILGETEECAADRIRSVYGGEAAGGFTGLMESGNLAETGNLSVLMGLIKLENVLGLLGAVYPTQTGTAVYGPLRNLDVDTWNSWVDAVGSGGVYGQDFPADPVGSQEELNALIRQYAYGYHVKAGRMAEGTSPKQIGSAGGYVGRMSGGVITRAHGWDAQSVMAYQSAGGFAGEMVTEGAAEIGGVSILGLPVTGAISAVQAFVPVIRNSDITGFQSGLQVKAVGIPKKSDTLKIEKTGYAGGFVGHMTGGQIWGNWEENSRGAVDAVPDETNKRCFAANVRKVEGTYAVGGFAGQIDPGSAAALDTASGGGLLGGLLQNLIKTPGDLAQLLNSTLSTVRGADVYSWDDWGIVVNGAYQDGSTNTKYARAAGGFAGVINGAVIGEKDRPDNGIRISRLRSVTGGEYAGGFFGLADVSAVAELTGEGNTSILAGLIGLGSVDVLDAFRTYIYDSEVTGSVDGGLEVQARDGQKLEYDNSPVYTGSAGGFGGALLNGSVKNSSVLELREVKGQNYTGGFIGHLGKSGVVDADAIDLLGKLVGLGAGVLDVFGSHVDGSKAVGVAEGYTVISKNTLSQTERSEIAGGFTGFADLAKMEGNEVSRIKQVSSGEIAGGFAGKTSFAYLAEIKGDSALVKRLLGYLDTILKELWVKDLEAGDVVTIDLGLIKVDALYDGDLIHLKLLGLNIRIALVKESHLAIVYIGDSKIELNCGGDGSILDPDSAQDEIRLSLIKANRTRIEGCRITGIEDGYDVYGGGAGNTENGSGKLGIAGGFAGFNDEGLLKKNEMFLADVIRGAKGLTGPFTGTTSLDSSWDFNTVSGIEGEDNFYRIYREPDLEYKKMIGKGGQELQYGFEADPSWNIYTIRHMEQGKVEQFTDLEGAWLSNDDLGKELLAYLEEGAKAVLMDNTPTEPTDPGDLVGPPNLQDPCKDTVELQIRKVWKNDREEDRPDEIRLVITRTYEADGQVIEDEGFKKEVILSQADRLTDNLWEKILSGLEYTAYRVGEGEARYYYTYWVSEDALHGYTTKITYEGDHQYDVTIINEKPRGSLLPDTGGPGEILFYTAGILLLAWLGMTELKKRHVGK